jgi:hypothetical protein
MNATGQRTPSGLHLDRITILAQFDISLKTNPVQSRADASKPGESRIGPAPWMNGKSLTETTPLLALSEHFTELEDPRVERTKVHPLLSIVTITICAVIGGAETWDEIAAFG